MSQRAPRKAQPQTIDRFADGKDKDGQDKTWIWEEDVPKVHTRVKPSALQ